MRFERSRIPGAATFASRSPTLAKERQSIPRSKQGEQELATAPVADLEPDTIVSSFGANSRHGDWLGLGGEGPLEGGLAKVGWDCETRK